MVEKTFICRNPKSVLSLPQMENDDYCIFILATGGEINCLINGKETGCTGGITILIPPHPGVISSLENLKGYVMGVKWDFLKALPHWNDTEFLSNISSMPFRALQDKDIKLVSKYFAVIQDSIKEVCNGFSDTILKYLIQAFTACCVKYYTSNWEHEKTARLQQISKEFIRLVSENVMNERGLGYYADRLCITPKYLSDVISRTTGRNALAWIEEFFISKAKQMLTGTDISVTAISRQMNFSTPSDFCKYFRNSVGQSPRQYRAGHASKKMTS